jgi:hypothetical protein
MGQHDDGKGRHAGALVVVMVRVVDTDCENIGISNKEFTATTTMGNNNNY